MPILFLNLNTTWLSPGQASMTPLYSQLTCHKCTWEILEALQTCSYFLKRLPLSIIVKNHCYNHFLNAM